MNFRIHILDRFDFHILQELKVQENLEVLKLDDPYFEIEKAEALLIRSGTKVNEELLNQAKSLKIIITATSGFDHIDIEACKNKNIACYYCPEANIISAAEQAFSLLLAFQKQIITANQQARNSKWRDRLDIHEVSGKNLGIIGLGRVGQRLTKIAKAFDMSVFAYDPYIDSEVFTQLQVEQLGLEETLKMSDFVSLHIPHTKETHRMIRKPTLAFMNEETVLINTSRGEVIFEEDLIHCLENRQIKGACLDVMESEPLPSSHRLAKCPNLILSPHIGGSSQEALHRASRIAVDKLLQFLKGVPPQDALPPTTRWYNAGFSKDR